MKRILSLLVLLFAGYLLVDYAWPRKSNLREFVPADVARLDTEMWRSYYDRNQVKLIGQLVNLFRAQYRASWVDATRDGISGRAGCVCLQRRSNARRLRAGNAVSDRVFYPL